VVGGGRLAVFCDTSQNVFLKLERPKIEKKGLEVWEEGLGGKGLISNEEARKEFKDSISNPPPGKWPIPTREKKEETG